MELKIIFIAFIVFGVGILAFGVGILAFAAFCVWRGAKQVPFDPPFCSFWARRAKNPIIFFWTVIGWYVATGLVCIFFAVIIFLTYIVFDFRHFQLTYWE